jgi:uncharacterized protein YgbK (DUF1537 family)
VIGFTVFADDVSGAADAGFCFTRLSSRTVVSLRPDPPLGEDVDVWIAVTRDRALFGDALEQSWHRWRPLAERGAATGELVLKMDSLARGSWPHRLRQLLETSGSSLAVVMPAVPALGRTTVAGVQLLRGQPVAETEAGRDPVTPVATSSLPELAAQAGRVFTIGPEEVRAGSEAMARALRTGMEKGATIVVADATEDSHAEVVVAAVRRLGLRAVWAGSNMLLEALVDVTSPSKGEDKGRGVTFPSKGEDKGEGEELPRPHLYVIGSLSSANREQLHELQAPVAELGQELPSAAGDLALVTPGATDQRGPDAMSAATATAVAELVARRRWGTVAATGGETAAAVLLALGAWGLELVQRIGPGTVASRVLGGPHEGLCMVTKVGAMGTLADLSGRSHPSV